jgi:2-oxoglutarate ferredoxin oxidoreductase subunit delta
MKGRVSINRERCKGCGLCVSVCPQKILASSQKSNRLGVYVVEVKKEGECLGCSRCAIICPDTVIEVLR